jgi:CRISPR-associated protein (TIGR03986 family)
MTLKVPYNFVPLNEKVVTPYWIDHISHDIPFRDGRSGTLKLTLTAESPIFVKRGEAKSMTQKNTDSKGAQIDPYEFEKDAAGKYFIPGSSLRGMVRSVVETLSFGRMLGRVSERRYAVRDLSNSKLYTDHFKPGGNDPLQCGWLKKEGDDYFIYGCGEPGRISHRTIEQYTGVPMEKFFTRGTREYRRSEKEQKSAQFKYDLFKKHGQQHFLEQEHSFVRAPNDEEKDTTKDKRKIFVFTDDKEQSPGKLVFTGQPDGRNNNRTPPTGKRLEFIFFETSLENKVLVSEEVMDDFRFAYFNHRPKTEQSDDYMERNKQLEGGDPIPVFYKFKELKNGRPYGVKHFGLSYLYKLPYKYTVEDSIKNYQTDKDGNTNADGRDLADAIFGMVGESKNASTADFLKGRVQFSHAKMKGETKKLKEERVILGEPRASFYPTYLNQNAKDNGDVSRYKTFMDKKGQVAGRKRYPVLEEGTRQTRTHDEKDKALSEAVFTKFLPLDKGTSFTCELSYHNLRAVELGALLSALTLHGTGRSRHQVGMAKPLGFGKIKVSVAGIPDEEQQELMLRYEAYMDQELGGPDAWRTSPQVTELVTLTAPVHQRDVEVLDSDFAYNSLDGFRKVKNNKEGLPLHSQMRKNDKPEIGLDSTQKASFQQELDKDRATYKKKQVLTPSLTKELIENEEKWVRQQFSEAVDTKLKVLEQQLDELRAAEKQRALEAKEREDAARRALKEIATSAAGLDLSDVTPKRDAIDKMKKRTDQYLGELGSNAPQNGQLPETDHITLVEKVTEIHASGKAMKTAFKGKYLETTQNIIAAYLGQEGMEKLFAELNKK